MCPPVIHPSLGRTHLCALIACFVLVLGTSVKERILGERK